MEIMSSPFKIPDPEKRIANQPFTFGYIDGGNWRIPQKYSYRTEAGETSTVRIGFVFDFATIPRPFRIIYPPAGSNKGCYGIAALWHDWLYAHRKIRGREITRKEADDLFLEIMLYIKVSPLTARIMYRAVRIGGGVPWRKRKAEDIIQ